MTMFATINTFHEPSPPFGVWSVFEKTLNIFPSLTPDEVSNYKNLVVYLCFGDLRDVGPLSEGAGIDSPRCTIELAAKTPGARSSYSTSAEAIP